MIRSVRATLVRKVSDAINGCILLFPAAYLAWLAASLSNKHRATHLEDRSKPFYMLERHFGQGLSLCGAPPPVATTKLSGLRHQVVISALCRDSMPH